MHKKGRGDLIQITPALLVELSSSPRQVTSIMVRIQ